MSESPSAPSLPRYQWIDAVRGWAILGVLLVHGAGLTVAEPLDGTARILTGFGARGVQLFFLISAITLYFTAERKWAVDGTRGFYLRRIFRIYPLYILALIVCAHNLTTPLDTILHATFLNAWHPVFVNSMIGVEWSLAAEMNFYLIFPLIFAYVRNLKRALILVLVSMEFLTICRKTVDHFKNQLDLSQQVSSTIDTWTSSFWLPACLPAFAVGIALYFLIMKRDLPPHLAKYRVAIGWTAGAASVTMNWFLLFVQESYFFPAVFYYACSLSLFIVCVFYTQSRLFTNVLTQYLGRLSYGIYLFHMTNYWLTDMIFQTFGLVRLEHPALYILTHFGLCVGLAQLLYTLIEVPCIRWGDRLIKSSRSRASIPASAR